MHGVFTIIMLDNEKKMDVKNGQNKAYFVTSRDGTGTRGSPGTMDDLLTDQSGEIDEDRICETPSGTLDAISDTILGPYCIGDDIIEEHSDPTISKVLDSNVDTEVRLEHLIVLIRCRIRTSFT